MNLNNPTEFRQAWDAIDDPKEIREAFERDQEADDKTDTPRPAFMLVGGKQVRIGDE